MSGTERRSNTRNPSPYTNVTVSRTKAVHCHGPRRRPRCRPCSPRRPQPVRPPGWGFPPRASEPGPFGLEKPHHGGLVVEIDGAEPIRRELPVVESGNTKWAGRD